MITRKPKIPDYENHPNPQGNIALLAYGLAKGFVNNLAQQKGMPELWPTIQPQVTEIVHNGLSGIEVPNEAMVLLKLFQAGMQPNIQDSKTQDGQGSQMGKGNGK